MRHNSSLEPTVRRVTTRGSLTSGERRPAAQRPARWPDAARMAIGAVLVALLASGFACGREAFVGHATVADAPPSENCGLADDAERITWERAADLVGAGRVTYLFQFHDRTVCLRTRDGARYSTTEPRLDD